MKQKDMVLIVVVVIVSAVLSTVASKVLIAPAKNRQQKVEVVMPITPDFKTPSSKYFNTSSVDPTQLITIGNNTNPQPFNGTGQ
jgi:hypothetical protein